jgi:hypothetical protein
MSDLKSKIGLKSPVLTESVNAADIDQFGRAIGAHARKELHPTFLAKLVWKSEMALFDLLKVQLNKVLHGEQEYRFHRPLKPGMKIEIDTSLENGLEKKGASGPMYFLVFRTRVWEAGQSPESGLVAEARKTGIVRGGE